MYVYIYICIYIYRVNPRRSSSYGPTRWIWTSTRNYLSSFTQSRPRASMVALLPWALVNKSSFGAGGARVLGRHAGFRFQCAIAGAHTRYHGHAGAWLHYCLWALINNHPLSQEELESWAGTLDLDFNAQLLELTHAITATRAHGWTTVL